MLNAVIPHNTTKGNENEESVRSIIRSFIPDRYRVGSGIIIDSFGGRSRQVDIVIYDSYTYPTIFGVSSIALFPVETVIAAIEIKTYFDNAKLLEVIENCTSIRKLRHYCDKITINVPSNDSPVNIVEFNSLPPSVHLLAFRVDSQNYSTWQKRFLQCNDAEGVPDTSLLLDISSVFSFVNPEQRRMEDLQCGFFAVRTKDAGIDGPPSSFIDCDEPGKQVFLDGCTYHSAKFQKDNRYPVLMPERAFLSFLVRLNKAIHVWPKHTEFDPSKYLDNDYTAFHSV